MAQKTRKQLQNLFKQGAKPSGDDFSNFVESTFNIKDDGLEKPVGADAPLKIISYGAEENLLDFYTGNSHSWRLNQKPSAAETAGLNFENAAGSSKLFIASSSGNVGVSTTSPKAKLHILQSGNADALRIDDTENDTTPFLIDKDGNVGIRTTSPGATLDVNGSARATFFVGNGTNITGLSATKITTGTLSASVIPNLSASKITSDTLSASRIPNLSATKITSGRLYAVRIPSLSANKITTGTLNAARIPSLLASKITSGTLAGSLTITSGGKVGIGTTNPGAKLEVMGSGSTIVDLLVNGRIRSNNNDGGLWVSDDRFVGGLSTNKIGIYNNGAWRLTVLNDGKVGIGTNSPGQKLQVSGNVKVSGKLYVKNDLSVPGGEEDLRMLRGIINTSGSVRDGEGFTSNRPSTGIYDITFTPKFSDNPAASVTQIFEGLNKAGGNTLDNTTIVYIDENYMRVKTGMSTGAVSSRRFTFIVIGPR